MKRALSTLFLILVFGAISFAQEYKTAIGLRGGSQSGITFKQFISEKSVLEGLVATRWDGVYLTGLYEWVGPYFDVKGFIWYMGAGAHVGFFGEESKRFDDGESHTVVGVDGILGVEYKLQTAPICFGFDWKPQYDFIGDKHFVADDLALSVRYTFGKKE